VTAVLDIPTEAPAATGTTGPLADLILVRLLPAVKKPPRSSDILKSLTPFFTRPPTPKEFDATLAALRQAALVSATGQTLTDAGRQRALAYLGLTKPPAKLTWQTIQSTYLLSKALGLPAKELKKPGVVAAILLKRKLGLPVGTRNTLSAVFDAFACQLLGFPERTKMNVRAAILSKRLAESEPLSAKEMEKALPAALLAPKTSGKFDVKVLALAGWADGGSAPATCPPAVVVDEAFDLADFAATVRSEARRCPTGRFGDNKVFISHVWRRLRDEPRFRPLGLDGFKAKLVEANRADLLTLSRADLVQVMDPQDVRESEAVYLNASFHFILIAPE
jgi:hypothetical protein